MHTHAVCATTITRTLTSTSCTYGCMCTIQTYLYRYHSNDSNDQQTEDSLNLYYRSFWKSWIVSSTVNGAFFRFALPQPLFAVRMLLVLVDVKRTRPYTLISFRIWNVILIKAYMGLYVGLLQPIMIYFETGNISKSRNKSTTRHHNLTNWNLHTCGATPKHAQSVGSSYPILIYNNSHTPSKAFLFHRIQIHQSTTPTYPS